MSKRVMMLIRSPRRVRTISPFACRTAPCGSRRYDPTRAGRWPGWRPAGSGGPGGRPGKESSGEFAALVLQRDRGHGQPGVLGQQGDDAVHVRRLERPGEPVDEPCSAGDAGRRLLSPRRQVAGEGGPARLRALFTDCSLAGRISAASLARKSRTSRRIRAARCRGGRSWSAVTNASEIASLASYWACGSGACRAAREAARRDTARARPPRRAGWARAGRRRGWATPWARPGSRAVTRSGSG